ncbi:hypothetical protein ACWM9A_13720 [Acetobacter pasteurianus]
MKYQAQLKDLNIQKEDGAFSVDVTIAVDLTDPLEFFGKEAADPKVLSNPSFFRIGTVLEILPATTEDQWVVWALDFLKGALPQIEVKPASGAR